MGRCGGMAAYAMAVILLVVALFASSAKCRPEPLQKASGSNGNAAVALNSTTAASVTGGGGGSGDAKLEWCITRKCVYEGRGNAPCFCCAAHMPTDPPQCHDTMDLCHRNCV